MNRKIFSKIFLCFFSVFLLFLSLSTDVSAQQNSGGVVCDPDKANPGQVICRRLTQNVNGSIINDEPFTLSVEEAKKSQENNPNFVVNDKSSRSGGECNPIPYYGNFSIGGCIMSIADTVFGFIISIVNKLLNQILWLTSYLLDFVIYFTVVKFKANFVDLQLNVPLASTGASVGVGSLLVGQGGGGIIYYLWGILRDLLNVFIFLSVMYFAVRSMFDGFTETRKRFLSLLVFSIIANFSLLFVKIAIDVSNILTLSAYTYMAKPSGVDTFTAFRTRVGDSPAGLGEFIMNTVSMSSLVSKQNGSSVAQAEIKNTTSTFLFQLGNMLVYIGVIYLFFQIIGILLTRAAAFLLAMILASFIVLDLFAVFIKGNDGLTRLVDGVKDVTGKINGDFATALVKGPVMMIFLFIVGAVAQGIFSSGISDAISNSAQMKDFALVDSSLSRNLIVFFKFLFFFKLVSMVFEKLNSISFGPKPVWSDKYGKAIGNFMFGKGANALSTAGGFVGRNVIGRAANGDNRFARGLVNLNNRAEQWKTSEFFLKKKAGELLGTSAQGLRGGTYDARNFKTLSTLGGKVLGATDLAGTSSGVGKIIGDGVTGGFAEQEGKRISDAKTKIDKQIKEAGSGLIADRQTKYLAKVETKIKDTNVNLAQFDAQMSDSNFRTQITATPAGGTVFGLSSDDVDFYRKAIGGDPDILNKIDSARSKSEDNLKKKMEAKKEALQKQIKTEATRAGDPNASIQEQLQRSGSGYSELLSDAITGRRGAVREGVATEFRKAAAKSTSEKGDVNKKMAEFITTSFNKSALDTLQEIAEVERLSALPNSRITISAEDQKVFRDAKLELGVFVNNISTYSASNSAAINDFDENLFKKLVDLKKKAMTSANNSTATAVYDPTTGTVNKAISKLNNDRVRLMARINSHETEIARIKPKKDEPAKPAGDAKGDAKK